MASISRTIPPPGSISSDRRSWPGASVAYGEPEELNGDSGMADPRIEQGVGGIEQEQAEHVGHGDEHHRALDGEVVPLEHALHQVLADARDGEEDLDDERATDEATE